MNSNIANAGLRLLASVAGARVAFSLGLALRTAEVLASNATLPRFGFALDDRRGFAFGFVAFVVMGSPNT